MISKKYCKKQRYAPGLVNAVLRSAIRTKGELKQPVSLEDRYSHPQKLIDLLKENVGGKRLEAMLKANNSAPDTVVQVNTLRITAEALKQTLQQCGINAEDHPWMADCLILSHVGNLEQLPAFQEGLFYVQDAAANLVPPFAFNCLRSIVGAVFLFGFMGIKSIKNKDYVPVPKTMDKKTFYILKKKKLCLLVIFYFI